VNRSRLFFPLFFISMSTIGMEVTLLRYFAATSWASFGSMVISIALLGFAVSGTVLTLSGHFFQRRFETKLLVISWLYLITIPLAFLAANFVAFNPNKMLNVHEIGPEVLHLSLFFAIFFVPFFLAGLFTGLTFLHHHKSMGKIYFFDLAGAGSGSLFILAALFFVSPFDLAAVDFGLAFLAFGAVLLQTGVKGLPRIALLVSAALFLPLFLGVNSATYRTYKPIRQAQMAAGNRALLPAPLLSPLGIMEVLSNATEKATLPLSDDFSQLVPDGKIPEVYPGFYLDGNRVDGLLVTGPDNRFVGYSLDAAPFLLLSHPDVLVLGSGGGFGTYQALSLGAGSVQVVESNPFLIGLLRSQFAAQNGGLFLRPDVNVLINDGRSFALRDTKRYDLIEISDAAIAARPDENYLLTTQALADDSRLLKPNGVLSVTVDVSDNFFYALKLLNTIVESHLDRGLNPASRIVILRSLFRMVFLVKNSDFTAAEVAALRQFSSNLGFDAVWFPGAKGTEPVFSLAPYIPVTRAARTGDTTIGSSPILDDDQFFGLARDVIDGRTDLSNGVFDYRPTTDDRPYFFSLLRPDRLGLALKTYDLGGLPPQEIPSLVLYAEGVNVAFFALVIVLIPVAASLFRRRKLPSLGRGFFTRSALYFAALGLGFLFIEIVLIQKLALFLGDVIYSFTLVLASILVFAGLGSFLTEKFHRSKTLIRWAALGVVIGVAFLIWGLPPLIRTLGTLEFPYRLLLSFVFTAPLALPLGVFFPTGLSRLTGHRRSFIPWAWSINGAFSVVSTVSARILSQSFGFTFVLVLAALLYVIAASTAPTPSEEDAPAP